MANALPLLSPQPPTATGPYGDSLPSTKPSGNAQVAVTRGLTGQMVCTFAAAFTAASVATLTTAGQTITPIGGTGATVSIATTDVVFVTKPAFADNGIWVGNVSASAANTVTVNFGNPTAGFLTPTATQTYGIVALKGFPALTLTISPTAVGPSTTVEQQFALTGIRTGEAVYVSKPLNQAGLDVVGYRVVGNNVLGITYANVTSGTLTPTASEAYTVVCLGGINATHGMMSYQVTFGSVASVGVTAATTGAYNLTLSNVALTDQFQGAFKPTNQSGTIASGGKISSAGVVNIFIANYQSAGLVTPTANEVWSVDVLRPAALAPMVVYTTTITPVSITALSTASQTFLCTGLISVSPVFVNGPAQPAGVGIGGAAVSSTNNVRINFINVQSATWLTPTAGTYYVANFQQQIDAPGNSVLQPASYVTDQISVLTNAMQSVLTQTGWMVGA